MDPVIRNYIEDYHGRRHWAGSREKGESIAKEVASRLADEFRSRVFWWTEDYLFSFKVAFPRKDLPNYARWATPTTHETPADQRLGAVTVFVSWVGPFVRLAWAYSAPDIEGHSNREEKDDPPQGLLEAHERILTAIPTGIRVLRWEELSEVASGVTLPPTFLAPTGPGPTVGSLLFCEYW